MYKIYDTFISSNKTFWKQKNNYSDEFLLYEALYSEPHLVYGVSKIALTIANIKNMTPICIKPAKNKPNINKLIHSMNDIVTGGKLSILATILPKAFEIVKIINNINGKNDLIELRVNNCYIGKYLYDSILIKFRITSLEKINIKIIAKIAMELCYFFYFEKIINRNKIRLIVLGDTAYRYGFLFELAKVNKITCVSPINLNTLSLNKYINNEDFNACHRKPSLAILESINENKASAELEIYFEKRFKSLIKQHDILTAFNPRKKIYTKNELLQKYELRNDLPIIVVMAHIFCDAPHSYPDMLYTDYQDWFVNTVKNLQKNKNINFLIKKHPSSHLYSEQDTVEKILTPLGLNKYLLDDDTHTLSILNECDIVITCGGTIGLEFLYHGKPVVVAAKPPYSGFGLTTEPNNKADYEKLLISGIEKIQRLSPDQRKMAIKIAYHDFILLNNRSNALELGGEFIYMNKENNIDDFFQKVISENETPLDKQNIYFLLQKFLNQNEKSLIRDDLI